jgi:hypothetical protein
MVLEEGREDGIGIWEVDGYEVLCERVESVCYDYIGSSDWDIEVEDILVVGSYGAGMGVEGESDLDLVILVYSGMDPRSGEYSEEMKYIAGSVNSSEGEILSGFCEFDGLEAYVYPFLERGQRLGEMAKHEPVDTYYNLSEDGERSYY